MSTTSFDLKLLSPSKTYASLKAKAVILRGTEGYMTILPDHAAMIAELDAGEMTVDGPQGSERYFISGGYVEVDKNKVSVLADSVEAAKDINVAKAEERLREIQAVLSDLKPETDVEAANRRLREAEAYLSVAKGESQTRN